MPLAATVLLLILAVVLFGIASWSVPTGRFQPGWAGLLVLTLTLWLLPLLIQAL